jgi:erythromycin esterase
VGSEEPQTFTSLARAQAEQAVVLNWAKETAIPLSTLSPNGNLSDLAAFGAAIKEVKVLALGEGVHGAAEPLNFRNRLLQYLVQDMGFTAIACETGIVEGRTIHDFVAGGDGDPSTVMREGFSWTFDQLPQNRALVDWLRIHNAATGPCRHVNFYGYDVPGSPGEPRARRGMETGLSEAIQFLYGADVAAARLYGTRLSSLLPYIRLDPLHETAGPSYEKLVQADRDVLTAAISDLISLLERREITYTASNNKSEYEWAYRAAIGARQLDSWLRQFPLDWCPCGDPSQFTAEQAEVISNASDVRDRAQADNLRWIIDREGPEGKVLVFGHNQHICAAPFLSVFTGLREHTGMGTYLRRCLGPGFAAIGNVIGSGVTDADSGRLQLAASADSLDGLASQVDSQYYLLNLQDGPSRVSSWLQKRHAVGHGPWKFHAQIKSAFDLLVYMDVVTPAYASAESHD